MKARVSLFVITLLSLHWLSFFLEKESWPIGYYPMFSKIQSPVHHRLGFGFIQKDKVDYQFDSSTVKLAARLRSSLWQSRGDQLQEQFENLSKFLKDKTKSEKPYQSIRLYQFSWDLNQVTHRNQAPHHKKLVYEFFPPQN